jgi:hypothetical protein
LSISAAGPVLRLLLLLHITPTQLVGSPARTRSTDIQKRATWCMIQASVAVSNPICTHEELAAPEFEPDPYFIGFDKDPARMEEHEEKLRSIGIISRFAVALLGKTKAELID